MPDMRKPRDDSKWNRLAADQRELLEEWLFDENQGLKRVLELARKEFGIEGSLAGIGRYYRRRARERQALEMVEAAETALDLNQLPISKENLQQSVMKLVAKTALRTATERPEALKDLESLTKLMLQSEDNDLRRERLKLAQLVFHYEATVAARTEFPKLSAYMRAMEKDGSLDAEAKAAHLEAVLFPNDRVFKDLDGLARTTKAQATGTESGIPKSPIPA